MRILFVFWLLCTTLVEAQSRSVPDLQWLRLLHYKQTGSQSWEGELDSANFYLHPEGKTNPDLELEANKKAFQDPKSASLDENLAPQCRFPARYVYLRNLEPNAPWVNRDCPRFQNWYQTLRGVSASLIFSSYYLNNPSSTFGHTLLRVNKAPNVDGKRHELLDYGVNFAANPTTSNPLLYSFMGLLGGFKGTFTTVPYYYKVREYNNSESRDLWDYELNLTQAEVDRLVMHVWEVGPTYADYWYLTENCSYFMLGLLEAARPELQLTSKLKKYVIPTDTVKVVAEEQGLLKTVSFRPSIRTELFERLKELTADEKSLVVNIVDQKKISNDLAQLSETRRRLVLDAALDYMDYKHIVAVQVVNSPEWKFKNELLAHRSQINEITPALKIRPSPLEAPETGHGSRRVTLGYLSNKNAGNYYLFNYRFAFHDLSDFISGFPEYAQISFFDIRLAYEERPKKLELEEFRFFEVISLNPYSAFTKSLSWRLLVGVEKMVNEQCPGCHATTVSGGAGYTLDLSTQPLVFAYLGIRAGVYYTDRDHRGLELPRLLLGAGPNLVTRIRWTPSQISILEGWYRKDAQVKYNEYKEVSFSHQGNIKKDFAFRITGVERWIEQSAGFELLYYY